MHAAAHAEVARFVGRHLSREESLKILEVGSLNVNGSLRGLFLCPEWSYVGLDLAPGPGVDIVTRCPYDLRDVKDRFDVIVSVSTLEHAARPWELMVGMRGRLVPGGWLCVVAPSGGFEHRHPIDCWRFYPDGMRELCRYAGLTEVECYKNNDPPWFDTVLIARRGEK